MKIRELLRWQMDYNDRVLRPWQQWLIGGSFMAVGIAALILYILWREGLL